LILNAADSTESDPGVWKGVGELGYTSTSGNSDSENLNASLGISREIEKWKHSASLRTIQAESEGETSADSLVFKGRSEYAFGEKSYMFGKLRYEDDEFSGYDYQTSVRMKSSCSTHRPVWVIALLKIALPRIPKTRLLLLRT
jgi:putative salt-induced outer membrane protein